MLKQLLRWQNGRQRSGYDKMLLAGATWPFKFDVYLLKFPIGSEIAPHIDNVEHGKHFRLNIVLRAASAGGEFRCDKAIVATKRINLFRPDISEHSVTKVEQGTRYLLSIGWIRN